jgi:hypothetical protein
MAALYPASALLALANVDVELSANRLTGNLGLKLLGEIGLDQTARAVGTNVREIRFVDLVDLLGRGTMAVFAVLIAGFASGAFGVGLGRSLAEGSGLSLSGASGLVEFAAKACDLCGERLDQALLLLNKFQQFLIAGRTSCHRC